MNKNDASIVNSKLSNIDPVTEYINRVSYDENKTFQKIMHDRVLRVAESADEKKRSQDKFSCKRLFLESFMTSEMITDFPLIARDFYKNEYSDVRNHEITEYIPLNVRDTTPVLMYVQSVLNLMMNAVDFGSEYAKSLFLYLYKKYYKKEYQQIKRFSHLCADDVFSLGVNEEKNLNEFDMARMLTIAEWLDIVLERDCIILYEAM